MKEQETDISRPTYSASSQWDSAEERTNLDRSNAVSDDIALILPPNKSTNADKLRTQKNAFLPVGKQQ